MATDQETFRHVIGHFASGVTVLTTRDVDEDIGATASAVSSLSLDPPMLLVCLNQRSSTQAAIHASGRFAVNILDEDQGNVAERFASSRGTDKFADLAVERGEEGVPLLAEALASCECRVAESVVAGTHRVFLADVIRAVAREGSPLTYFRGKFGRFEVERDRVVYRELRRRILTRSISLTERLDIAVLAREFDTLAATVYHAVTQLVADGLLARDPARGYVLKPVTEESSEQAFDARCAIELGAAAMTVGRVPDHRVAALRALMEETEPLVAAGKFGDVEAFTRHNEAFHNAMVDLADNPTLSDAYRGLGVSGLMVSLLAEGSEAGREIVEEHQAIVEAYERGNLDEAIRMIAQHNETAKSTMRRAILAAGGEL
jgi:flavin reductase (DIM6/NTAB) family NADH-FMN oxidoreductase RutF/DNA-binding GntR family transcriptional regulator